MRCRTCRLPPRAGITVSTGRCRAARRRDCRAGEQACEERDEIHGDGPLRRLFRAPKSTDRERSTRNQAVTSRSSLNWRTYGVCRRAVAFQSMVPRIVAVDVFAQVREVEPEAPEQGPVIALQHAVEPAQHRPLEPAQHALRCLRRSLRRLGRLGVSLSRRSEHGLRAVLRRWVRPASRARPVHPRCGPPTVLRRRVRAGDAARRERDRPRPAPARIARPRRKASARAPSIR